MGWQMDWRRLRIYLAEKYGVGKAYYFIGFVRGNEDLYSSLTAYGYSMIFKPVLVRNGVEPKGNCDAEMVLQAMIDLDKYEKAVIVTSDGDFACLVRHLKDLGRLERVLASSRTGCSHLLKKAAGNQIDFVDNLRSKLEYKKKRTP
jgi:uncharacterized LabA/DUF88 family protein